MTSANGDGPATPRPLDTLAGMDDPTIEQRLSELEAASDRRRAELRAVLDDLPAALSRRALVKAAATDLRHAPGKGDIVRRGVKKLGRIVRGGFARTATGTSATGTSANGR